MTDAALESERRTIRSIADVLRTTLGPFGTNKLLLEANGSVSTTSVGRVVMERIDFESPFVTLLERSVEQFDDIYSDGTTTLVGLTGALLDEAASLSEEGCHATVIQGGYDAAGTIASNYLDEHAVPVDDVGLEAVARTAFTASRDPALADIIAELVLEALGDLSNPSSEAVDRNVDVVARTAGSVAESEVVHGVVLEQDAVSDGMPRSVSDAGVVVVTQTVDLPRLNSTLDDGEGGQKRYGFAVDSFDDRAAVRDWERSTFQGALAAGCDVVLTTEAINDRVKTILASNGVLGVQRIEEGRRGRIVDATGATAVSEITALEPADIGRADVEVRRIGGRDLTFIESADTDVRTLFCRAPNPRTVESFERSVSSVLAATARAAGDGWVVPAGGAPEIGAARAVRQAARSVDDRRQLAMEAYADALTTVPRTIAGNAGADGQLALARLGSAHADGGQYAGIDALDGSVRDLIESEPAVEARSIKRAVWATATDLAVQMVRLDEVVRA